MTLESNARFSKIQHLLTKVPNTNARTEIGSPACNEGRIERVERVERVVKAGPRL
tara:strand:- start:152 stop:316 length:165 start_codon:yes stop_codon:yes gene_type:complete